MVVREPTGLDPRRRSVDLTRRQVLLVAMFSGSVAACASRTSVPPSAPAPAPAGTGVPPTTPVPAPTTGAAASPSAPGGTEATALSPARPWIPRAGEVEPSVKQ